jgi:hypothetical protein
VTPKNGAVVGIAYPITAKFSAPVTNRAAAEHNLHVYVNGRFAAGAWYWRSSTLAMYRLAGFWPGHATIQVRMSLAGVEIGRTTKVRYIGATGTTRTHTIRTARALLARVDGKRGSRRVRASRPSWRSTSCAT